MQTKILSLALTKSEWTELCKEAGLELRDPKQHARYLLRHALGISNDPNAKKHSDDASIVEAEHVAA